MRGAGSLFVALVAGSLGSIEARGADCSPFLVGAPGISGPIGFDDITQTAGDRATLAPADHYRDLGVVFSEDLTLLDLVAWESARQCPEVTACQEASHCLTPPNGLAIGDGSESSYGFAAAIDAWFVVPGTCLAATTDWFYIEAMDDDGGTSLGRLTAYRADGSEIDTVELTTPTSCACAGSSTGAAAGGAAFEIRAPGIARVRLWADGDTTVFDNLAFARPVPLNVESVCTEKTSCIDDSLEIRFVDAGGPILDYEIFVPGVLIDVEAVIEAVSENIEGFSIGVTHDPRFVEIVGGSVTSDRTILESLEPEFLVTRYVPEQTETTPPRPEGWFQAAILSYKTHATLPLGEHVIARATYRLLEDPGEGGTFIRYVDEVVGAPNSPVVSLNVVIGGDRKQPRQVRNGWIVPSPATRFVRGDANADGEVDLSDAIWVLEYLYRGGPRPPCTDAADFDDDAPPWPTSNQPDLTDVVYFLEAFFRAGPGLPGPYPACGEDPTPDGLPGCVEHPPCSEEAACPAPSG